MAPKLYIFDMDGTLFRGDEPTPGATDVLRELRSRGASVRFLTNNSTQTRTFYTAKLRRLGFEAKDSEVYSSATGTAAELHRLDLKSAFVVGEAGLVTTLQEAGFQVVNAEEPLSTVPAEAVVVGLCKSFTYALMNEAMQRILVGATFVATNEDATYPMEGGRLIPGAGSVVAAVKTCSGHQPIVVGKPNPFLVELVVEEAGVSKGEALAIGDRLDTDIESGKRAGVATHLVLTGVEKAAPTGQAFSEDLRGLL